MPESPDFDKIARRIVQPWGEMEETVPVVRQMLADMWNARGIADAAAVDERLATLTGWVSSEPYRQHLREAIEALNR